HHVYLTEQLPGERHAQTVEISYWQYGKLYGSLGDVGRQSKGEDMLIPDNNQAWLTKTKLLNHYEPEIHRLYKCDDLLDRKKFGRIRRWLSRIGEIDDLYCATFNPLIEELRRVAEALDELAVFLNAICSEGNLRPFDDTRKRTRASSTDTTSFDGDSPSHSRFRYNPINIGSASSPPRPRSSSLPPLPSMQSPHPTTVPWKVTLSNRYPMESLYVSAAELEVFCTVLSTARTAKETVEQAQKLCHDREVMANDMQQVYEEWEEKCLDWKENDVGKKGTKEQEGYEA
ncbi:hypothetical protein MMC29_000200, partial [Sticta canariensis]|nr:hypothetical protein [Sticta canariensis]